MRPKISGSGTDDNGAFTLPANSATDLNGSNTFWKTSTTGEMVHDVAFEAGSGSTGSFTAKGSYTSTSKTFGKSGSVERSGTFGINESAGDLAAMSSKTDMVMTYAGGSVDSMKAKFFPHFSGSGFDAHGSYSLSGSTTVAGTSGKANLSMTKTYTDGSSMELAGEVPFQLVVHSVLNSITNFLVVLKPQLLVYPVPAAPSLLWLPRELVQLVPS